MHPAVALVPGFFGFDHRESQTYFADRFIAGLRAGLEARGVCDVPVVAVSTLGIASMWKRQKELLTELRALETPSKKSPRLGGPRRWHLVGHSTGGVDAALLLREHPLMDGGKHSVVAQGGWSEWSDLIERVRSVTTISAPHFGTALAESALARWSAGHPSLAALRDAAHAALDVARRGDLRSRVSFMFSAMPKVSQTPLFLLQILFQDELARDLHPKVMGEIGRSPFRLGAQARTFSIATVSPRPARDHDDKLFRDMWRWTHEAASRVAPPPIEPSWLDDASLRLSSQRHVELAPIDDGDNDGVVSTTRQVVGKAIALVVGDHVDVLGRYKRTSLVDGKVVDPGLLTSGADFGDDDFFALMDRIAARLAESIRADAASG